MFHSARNPSEFELRKESDTTFLAKELNSIDMKLVTSPQVGHLPKVQSQQNRVELQPVSGINVSTASKPVSQETPTPPPPFDLKSLKGHQTTNKHFIPTGIKHSDSLASEKNHLPEVNSKAVIQPIDFNKNIVEQGANSSNLGAASIDANFAKQKSTNLTKQAGVPSSLSHFSENKNSWVSPLEARKQRNTNK